MANTVKRTLAKDKRFFAALRKTGHITASAKTAGYSRRVVYNYKENDEEFAEEWEDALKEYTEELEAEADRRAKEGYLEPIYYQGKKVGTVRKYSDPLLIFRLKALDSEKYRDLKGVKHDGIAQEMSELMRSISDGPTS